MLVCGRYEGVDERFREQYVDDEISIGDFILTGGELAAMVIIDSITRLLPGVLGCAESAAKDTFSRNLLKHPEIHQAAGIRRTPGPGRTGIRQPMRQLKHIGYHRLRQTDTGTAA